MWRLYKSLSEVKAAAPRVDQRARGGARGSSRASRAFSPRGAARVRLTESQLM